MGEYQLRTHCTYLLLPHHPRIPEIFHQQLTMTVSWEAGASLHRAVRRKVREVHAVSRSICMLHLSETRYHYRFLKHRMWYRELVRKVMEELRNGRGHREIISRGTRAGGGTTDLLLDPRGRTCWICGEGQPAVGTPTEVGAGAAEKYPSFSLPRALQSSPSSSKEWI